MAERKQQGKNAGGSGTQANRDRSDLKGSPRRDTSETGERGSSRSPSNTPSTTRDTKKKHTT